MSGSCSAVVGTGWEGFPVPPVFSEEDSQPYSLSDRQTACPAVVPRQRMKRMEMMLLLQLCSI